MQKYVYIETNASEDHGLNEINSLLESDWKIIDKTTLKSKDSNEVKLVVLIEKSSSDDASELIRELAEKAAEEYAREPKEFKERIMDRLREADVYTEQIDEIITSIIQNEYPLMNRID